MPFLGTGWSVICQAEIYIYFSKGGKTKLECVGKNLNNSQIKRNVSVKITATFSQWLTSNANWKCSWCFRWNYNVSTHFPEIDYLIRHDESKIQQELIQNVQMMTILELFNEHEWNWSVNSGRDLSAGYRR